MITSGRGPGRFGNSLIFSASVPVMAAAVLSNIAHAAPDVTMADSTCSISAILAPTLSCTSYILAKSCAVELIASNTSGNINDPDKKVMVTDALITGVTPSSLNKSRTGASGLVGEVAVIEAALLTRPLAKG